MQSFMRRAIVIAWWLIVALIPLYLLMQSRYLTDRCPPTGDCYDGATLVKRSLLWHGQAAALLLWPPCAWHLGLGFVVGRVRRRKT